MELLSLSSLLHTVLQESRYNDELHTWFTVESRNTKSGRLLWSIVPTSECPNHIIPTLNLMSTSYYDTKTLAEKAAISKLKRSVGTGNTASSEYNLFIRNVELCTKMLKAIAAKHGGVFSKGVSRSKSNRPMSPLSTYFMISFPDGRRPFKIRVSNHLTYGEFHDGELPFEDWSRKQLTASDIYRAWKKYEGK